MASHPGSDPTAVLVDATGVPVAPHVAAHLARAVRGDAAHLGSVGAMLSAEHLAGRRFLPDPLPFRSASAAGLLDDVARRLALCLSVAVVDRVDVLRRAAGIRAADLVAHHDELVEVRSGRFRTLRPDVTAQVRASATPDELAGAHRSWARASREAQEVSATLWHTAVGSARGEELLADGLLELGALLLGRGEVCAAFAVAREASEHGSGARHDEALLVAGTAATWSGRLGDAEEWLLRASRSGDPAVQRSAADALELVRGLVSGSPRSSTGAAPVRWRPGPRAGAMLAGTVRPLVAHAPHQTDGALLRAVVDALDLVDTEPDTAADVLGDAAVGVVPARDATGWSSGGRYASPLAEAHLRVFQALFLLCADEAAEAAAVLDDACGRLPVTCVAGGVVAEVAGVLDQERQGRAGRAATALQRLAPSPPTGVVAALRRGVAAVRARAGGAAVPSGAHVLASAPARGAGPEVEKHAEAVVDLPAAWARLLTARETDVVRLVVEGLSNREVARRLCVSVRTVEVHLGNAYRKLRARSRSELVLHALRPERWQASAYEESRRP